MRVRFLFVVAMVMCYSSLSTARPTAGPDSDAVEKEVRKVFDVWSTALTRGDKTAYLDTFWDSAKLVIRVADGEWKGMDAYRKRIEAAQLPPGNPADYRNVQVVALGEGGAVVTYERPAPGQQSTLFRGTAVFIKTSAGWKIAAWQAGAVTIKTQ